MTLFRDKKKYSKLFALQILMFAEVILRLRCTLLRPLRVASDLRGCSKQNYDLRGRSGLARLRQKKNGFKKLITTSVFTFFTMTFLISTIIPNTAHAQNPDAGDVKTGLVAHYRFDETAGTTLFDSSGNGNDGTMLGSLTGADSVEGKIGNALNFDENPGNDRISITDTGMPTAPSQPFSMGGWFRIQENSPQTAARWSLGWGNTADGTNDAQIIFDRNADRIAFEVGDTAGSQNVPNYLNQWMHVFLTFDGTDARLYQNSTSIRTTTITTFNPVSSNGTIGGRIGGGADYNGDIDDIRFYNRALSADDIALLYRSYPGVATGDRLCNNDYRAVMWFNHDQGVMQYCNGTDWVSVGEDPSNAAVSGCPNIGDTCDDGSIYAGLSPDGNIPMYATPVDQSSAARWGTSGFVTGSTSPITGQANSADVYQHILDGDGASNGNPNAFRLCVELDAYGHDDWYVPAFNELEILYSRRNTGDFSGTFDLSGSLSSIYWSSSESADTRARGRNFTSPSGISPAKATADYSVRCVRKGVIPERLGCTSPTGQAGEINYNLAEGMMQYCNGNNWVNMGPKSAEAGASADTLSPSAPTSGLVGHWALDETSGTTAVDSTGINNASLITGGNFGTYSVPGKLGNAYDSTVGTGQIRASNIPSYNSDTITLAAWINVQDNGNPQNIVRKGVGSTGWRFQINSSGILAFDRFGQAGLDSTAAITRDIWQHVAVTYDNTTREAIFYINGQDAGSETAASPGDFTSNTSDMTWIWNSFPFTGLLDDARIYNRVLDADEIRDLYRSSSLVGHWRLDETTGTTAVNTVAPGTNDGTVNGTDFDTDSVAGVSGTAINFDDSTHFVEVTNDPIFNSSQASVSLWFKTQTPISIPATNRVLFSKSTGGGFPNDVGNSQIIIWHSTATAANQIAFVVDDSTGSGRRASSGIIPEANRWYHVVGTYDGTNINVYVDGILSASQTSDTGLTNVGDIQIGSDGTTPALDGEIDDVRIYNRALSEAEVGQLYALTGGGAAPITGCPNIGDTCDDGSIYAGLSPDGEIAMYTTPADNGNTRWSPNGATYTTTGATDMNTGSLNTEIITATDSDSGTGGVQNHPAAEMCNNLSDHGHTDWYLPAQSELIRLYNNLVVTAGMGGFNNDYWSSTESATHAARSYNFTTASALSFNTKNTLANVRCIRTGSSVTGGACSNPRGIAGEIVYNDDFNIMQFCNGSEWVGMTDGSGSATVIIGSGTPPTGCTTPGDACSDGSIHAGTSPDGGTTMYMTTNAHEVSRAWSSTETTLLSLNDVDDGDGNTAALIATSNNYEAAQYCDSLVAHSRNDWYLPAEDETTNFWNGGSPIGGVLTDGSFYWASTEFDATRARGRAFDFGGPTQTAKANVLIVRCVRKD